MNLRLGIAVEGVQQVAEFLAVGERDADHFAAVLKQDRFTGVLEDRIRERVFAINEDEEWSICTSHVERHNLTIRTFMKRFARLALGFSKKLANLEAAINLYLAYYNFCWRTRYPDKSGKCGRYRTTAAMMAGVTDRLWTFDDLMNGGSA